jgi:hypothetical protein
MLKLGWIAVGYVPADVKEKINRVSTTHVMISPTASTYQLLFCSDLL